MVILPEKIETVEKRNVCESELNEGNGRGRCIERRSSQFSWDWGSV